MRISLVLAAILLLAGCTTPRAQTPPAPEATAPVRHGILEPVANATLPAATKSFAWALPNATASLALAIGLDFGDDNACQVWEGESEQPRGPGPTGIALFETPQGAAWASGGSGNLAAAHAGPIDTRDVTSTLGSGGTTGSLVGFKGKFSGARNVTFLARDLVPGRFTGDTALFFAFDCEHDVNFTSALAGMEVLMQDVDSLSGGVGAQAASEGSVSVIDVASRDIKAPVARAGIGTFGAQAARITLDHPGGQEQWTYEPTGRASDGPTQLVTGGPGTYTFQVTRAAAEVDVLWVAAWGLQGPIDLAAGRLDKAPVESPFA